MRKSLLGVVFCFAAALLQAATPPQPGALMPLWPGLAGLPAFQVGMSSWYGGDFQGRETSSGERFNMWNMTAAHRSLPFGTRVRITNLANGRALTLRINDRGPVPPTRVLDVSYAAARALDFVEAGLAPVRIDVLSVP